MSDSACCPKCGGFIISGHAGQGRIWTYCENNECNWKVLSDEEEFEGETCWEDDAPF